MKDIEKIILKIIKNNVPKSLQNSITLDSSLIEDLNFDSVKLLSLSVEFEKKANFDVLLASEEVDMTEIRTIKDIIGIVLQYPK